MANFAGYQFIAGTQVNLFNRQWIVEPPLGDGSIPMVSTDSYTRQVFKRDYLIDALGKGDMEFVDHRSETLKKELLGKVIQVGELTSEQENEAGQYVHYINELEVQGVNTFTKEKYRLVIQQVAERMGFDRQPSPITLWRKRRDFLQSGRQRGVLVKQHHRCGNQKPRFSEPEIYELIKDVVDKEWLTEQKQTLQEVYDKLQLEIAHRNELRGIDQQLPVPSYSTVWEYVDSLPRKLVIERRKGPKAAETKFRNCQHAPKPLRILEMVEVDHTRLDLILVDRKRNVVLGPASITVALDVYSRCITGFHVSYSPPSALSVNEMLKFAILKKSNLNTLCPELKHDYPVYGLPEMLILDNAKEFYSTSLMATCVELGIKITWAKRRKPWWKPHIERVLKTLNHSFSHHLPGTNFGSITKKGDCNPEKNAMVDFDDFLSALMKWIVDYYHQKPHRGLGGRVPAQAWAESAREFPPSLPRSRNALNAILGLHKTRTIGILGIEFEHLYYNSEELQVIRERFPLSSKAKVQIVVDEDDLSGVAVFDPYTNKSFHVPALDQEYTKDLTLHQHLVHKRNLAQQGKTHVKRIDLLKAKNESFAIAKGALCEKENAKSKVASARYMNIKQTTQDKLEPTNLNKVMGGDGENQQDLDQAMPISEANLVNAEGILDVLAESELNDDGWGSSFDGQRSEDSTGGEK